MKFTDRGGGDGVKIDYVVRVICIKAGEVVATLPRQTKRRRRGTFKD